MIRGYQEPKIKRKGQLDAKYSVVICKGIFASTL